MSKFVDVVITRQTKAVSQKGFGMPLILSADKAVPYKEYSGDAALASIATDFGGTASKTYKLAAAILGQTPKVNRIAVHGVAFTAPDLPTKLSTALNTLILSHNDWFYLTCTDQVDATVTELSKWIGTQDKFYVASTLSKVLSKTLNNQNVFLLVHQKPEAYPAEAWMGACAPMDVGSFTWTFKALNGIEAAEYTPGDVATIEENFGNTYIREGGVNITSNSLTTSGEYIDIIQSQYYIKSRMTENVFGLFVRTPKVPFTDNGIASVVAEVEKTLKDAYNKGIIADDADGVPMFVVHAPAREDISTNDRAKRTLPDLNWEATIAGAIESAKIGGTLKL